MDKKYHVNPNNGKISECKATKKCRYGDETIHFNNINEAKEYVEEIEQTNNNLFNKYKKPISHKPILPEDEKLFEYNRLWDSFNNKLTHEELRAMDYYTRAGSTAINDYLNNKETEFNILTDEEAQEYITHIDSFISKAPKKDKIVYHGVNYNHITDSTDEKLLEELDYHVGGEITFNSYLSTSIDPIVSQGYADSDGIVFVISTDGGAPPNYTIVNDVLPERSQDVEREIVLPRNNSYVISNITRERFYNRSNRFIEPLTVYLHQKY